jgi:tetratricopeptide (TPR) repeat protein
MNARRDGRATARRWTLGAGLGRASALLAGVGLGAALTVVGLAQAGRLKPPEEPAALVALGQMLDSEDRRVEIMVEKGDIKGAVAALESTRKKSWPTRKQGGDAALQLRHDHYGRLVRLRIDNPTIDTKSADQLLAIIDEGMGREYEMLDPNPFTARLLGMRGEVLEQLGRDDEALLAYEEALDMNRALLDRLLNPGSGGGR